MKTIFKSIGFLLVSLLFFSVIFFVAAMSFADNIFYNPVQIKNNLTVTGNTSLQGVTASATTLSGTVTSSATINSSGTLNQSGAFIASGANTLSGLTTVSNTLTSNSTINSNGAFVAAGANTLTGPTTVGNTLTLDSNAPIISSSTASIGSGSVAAASSILDLTSTTKGMLPPRMTTAQRDAISSPATGLTIFNITTNALNTYSGTAWVAVGSGSGSGSGLNLLSNPDFEDGGSTFWTNSGGTYAEVSAGSNLLFGSKSVEFTASGSGQYVQSDLYDIPVGLYGNACLARIYFKGGDANLTMQVLDGSSNVVASQVFSTSSSVIPLTVNFTCPTSGQLRLKIVSTAAASIVALDRAKIGDADNIGTVSQMQLVGTLRSEAITNCIWQITVGGAGQANFPADTDCNTPTVTGSITAPATKVPGFVVQGPGTFLVQMGAVFRTDSAADGSYTIRLSNGSDVSNALSATIVDASGFSASSTGGSFVFTITLPAGSNTVQLQGSTNNATLSLQNNTGADQVGLNFQVFKVPTAADSAFIPGLYNWRVDANISGANPDLGTAGVSSYTGIENGSLALTNNSTSTLTAQIPCSSTNAPSGTTCSAGDESVGVAFTIPRAGAVKACASFTHKVNWNATGGVEAAFQIVETPINAQTISAQGNERIESATINTSGAGDDRTYAFPHKVCGTFNFSSSGQKVLRLMYEQDYNATLLSNIILADASASVGQRDIHWEVYPIDQNVPAPVIYGTASMVRLGTGNGFGSTNTKIRRFANTITNTGTAITYADSASLGASFTINQAGTYCASYSDEGDTGAPHMGFSLNVSSGSTDLNAIAEAERLIITNFGTGNERGSVAWCGNLAVGDVVRPHTNSGTAGFISASGVIGMTIVGPK